MIGDEDLVARAKIKRPQHAVYARCRVGHEDDILRVGADQPGHALRRAVQKPLHLPGEEFDRPGFHPAAELTLRLEHDFGTCPERAVIEHRDRRVQRPGGSDGREAVIGERRGGIQM